MKKDDLLNGDFLKQFKIGELERELFYLNTFIKLL